MKLGDTILPRMSFDPFVSRFAKLKDAKKYARDSRLFSSGPRYVYHVIDTRDNEPVYVVTHEPIAAPLRAFFPARMRR